MSKFKVGDLVIGNENCYYSITNKTTICKVVKVVDDKYMKVKVIKHFKDRQLFIQKIQYSMLDVNTLKNI